MKKYGYLKVVNQEEGNGVIFRVDATTCPEIESSNKQQIKVHRKHLITHVVVSKVEADKYFNSLKSEGKVKPEKDFKPEPVKTPEKK